MLTTDPKDPNLKKIRPDGQNETYLVLSEEERGKGFVRLFRNKYIHNLCGVETKMGIELSETYARNPRFYGATYCVACKTHFPVSEFNWSSDNEVVGS